MNTPTAKIAYENMFDYYVTPLIFLFQIAPHLFQLVVLILVKKI